MNKTTRPGGRPGGKTFLTGVELVFVLSLVGASVASASAADLGPTVVPPAPPAAPGFSGPLATFAAPLAARGITFYATALDFAETNPSAGIVRGRAANSLYIVEGADLDLGKLIGLQGTSLHFENTFFPATENLNIAGQIGDSQVGYEPPFTPRIARLSRATIEQTAFEGHLDVEAGMTHPGYSYALFNCDSINSCFQDILFTNAGYSSYLFAVPGANVTYNLNPSLYIEAGAFAVQRNANFHIGYDFPDETYDGVLAMTEVGKKTGFGDDPYPYKVSLTGYANTVNHAVLNASSATGAPSRTVNGTSGVVLQAEKIVWRQDGGADPADKTPTALKVYTSVGSAIDSTMPIQQDVYIGTELLSPFASRPGDHYGLKFNWERVGVNYAQYLTAANLLSGGAGSPYRRDKYVFEANAHFALPLGMAFEPVVQYVVNPNSFYNPFTPVKAHDGVYLGGTYVIPLGTILGLASNQ